MKQIIILLIVFFSLSCSVNKALAQENKNITKTFKKEVNILVDYLDLINKSGKFFGGGYKYIEVNTHLNGIVALSPYSVVEIKDYETYFKYKGYYFFSISNANEVFGFQFKSMKSFDCNNCRFSGLGIDEPDSFMYSFSKSKDELHLESVIISYFRDYMKVRNKYD